MDNVTITIEDLEYKNETYTFDVKLWYSEKSEPSTHDYPGSHTVMLKYIDLDSYITAVDQDGYDRMVTDEKEQKDIMNQVSFKDRLLDYLSKNQ